MDRHRSIGRASSFPSSRMLWLAILAAVPALILAHHLRAAGGLFDALYFGQEYAAAQLPAVQALHPPAATRYGYDGQFYAQLAVEPLLRGAELEGAMDNASYRAQRIGLPWLAALGAGGDARRALVCFALANYAFWALLAGALLRAPALRGTRGIAACGAILWSSGTVVSLDRCLTDLPAAAIGLMGAMTSVRGTWSACLFGYSALVKETSILSLGALLFPQKAGEPWLAPRSLRLLAIATVPLALWFAYVHLRFPGAAAPVSGNFGTPLAGIASKILEAGGALLAAPPGTPLAARMRLGFELLAPLSLTVQAAYLLAKPRPHSRIWAFGCGFVLLFLVLGHSVWVEQQAYCRVLLPMTLAFNLQIGEAEPTRRFAFWALCGNVGLAGLAARVFVEALAG